MHAFKLFLFLSVFLASMSMAAVQIIDGSDIVDKSAPFSVYITGLNKCSASLITPTFVLTAAHCVDKFEPSGLILSRGETVNIWYPLNKMPTIKAVHIHPEYVEEKNDLALIELSAPVEDAPAVIPLYDQEILRDSYFPVEIFGYSEFGSSDRTDLLSYFKIEVTHNFRSNKDINGNVNLRGKKIAASLDGQDPLARITLYQLNGGICAGDSGGPVTVTIDGVKVQIGIHSQVETLRGTNNCNAHGFVTSVVPYIPWINKIIETASGAPIKTAHFETADQIAIGQNNDDYCTYMQGYTYNALIEKSENIFKDVCDKDLTTKLSEYLVESKLYCVTPYMASYPQYLENTITRLSNNCPLETF